VSVRSAAAAALPHRPPPALRLDSVTFRHASRLDAGAGAIDAQAAQLREVSLTARAGEMTAFVGASGSGKSTALQLLLGLQRPQAGRVLVDDADLAGLALDDYWSEVSAVFQDSLLFHTSIGENIRAGRLGATDAEVEAAAAAAGIADWVQTLPDRYDTMVSGDTCSGGQRQRIALARALIREPRLLVLDEPTSALDPSTGNAVMQTLRRVSAGRTTILVTHQLRDAAVAQQIVVFERGRIAESGTHAALLEAMGPYAALWAQQQGDRPAP
jgi:ABC-type multidrug transport system fused ATPase/permease subunit